MSIAYIANDYVMLLLNAMRLCSNLVHIGNANYEQKIIHQIIHFEQDDIFKKIFKTFVPKSQQCQLGNRDGHEAIIKYRHQFKKYL